MSETRHEAAIEAAAKVRVAQTLRQTSFPQAAIDEIWNARTDVEREAFGACVSEIIAAYEAALVGEGERIARDFLNAVAAPAGRLSLANPPPMSTEVHRDADLIVRACRTARDALYGTPLAALTGQPELTRGTEDELRAAFDAGSTRGVVDAMGGIRRPAPSFEEWFAARRGEAALFGQPEARRYSAEPDGREAVSGEDLAQAIDGVPAGTPEQSVEPDEKKLHTTTTPRRASDPYLSQESQGDRS